MVRPTGNGLSAVVDYQGRILGRRDYVVDGSGIMTASIPVHGAATVYGRIGDLFAYLCVAGLIGLAAWALVQRRQADARAHGGTLA